MCDFRIAIASRYPIESKVLGETRQVAVWTPAGNAAGRRYPVLYLTDAETQFGHTGTTAEFLARKRPQAIVVGIFNTDRARDLTPYKPNDREIEAQQPTVGGAGSIRRQMPTTAAARASRRPGTSAARSRNTRRR